MRFVVATIALVFFSNPLFAKEVLTTTTISSKFTSSIGMGSESILIDGEKFGYTAPSVALKLRKTDTFVISGNATLVFSLGLDLDKATGYYGQYDRMAASLAAMSGFRVGDVTFLMGQDLVKKEAIGYGDYQYSHTQDMFDSGASTKVELAYQVTDEWDVSLELDFNTHWKKFEGRNTEICRNTMRINFIRTL